jgi:hypothetical protein
MGEHQIEDEDNEIWAVFFHQQQAIYAWINMEEEARRN